MSAKIRIDDRHFRRTLEKYLEVSGKDLAQVLNDKAVSVMIEAGRNTKIADKKKIRSTFKWTKSHKKGLRAWALKYAPNLKTDKERKAWFTKIKNARIKSVAYLRAGWTAPLRKMKKAAKSKSKATIRGAGKSSPKLRGRARPAKAGSHVRWNGAAGVADGGGLGTVVARACSVTLVLPWRRTSCLWCPNFQYHVCVVCTSNVTFVMFQAPTSR